MLIAETWKDFKSYLRENIGYVCTAAIVVLAVYGIRAFRSSFCIDSEIMISQPDYMKSIWLGSNRFGMYTINEIFGLSRLSPYLSGFLMMVTMWITAVFLSYACRSWSDKDKESRMFTLLFPLLAVTSPLFAEQYLFILQAFEISMGLLLTVIAVYCADRAIKALWRRGASGGGYAACIFLLIGIISAVAAFGIYQTFVPLYIALVLISFILRYLNAGIRHPFKYCFCHAAVFTVSLVLYVCAILFIRHVTHSESAYISGMFRWRTDGIAAGLQAIKTVIKQCILGQGPFFQKWFLPAAGLFGLQGLIAAWKRKQGLADYMLFLVSMGMLLLTPFALVILTGGIQAARTELVYPFAAAFVLTHLTVLPKKAPKLISATMCAICLICLTRQGNTTVQMFQTAYEAYRNDVITASQMYPKIVEAADGEELSECRVTFIGSKRTSLQGPAVFGEISGRSLFDAEPSSRNGATNRLGPFFGILGMNMGILQDTEVDKYEEVRQLMQDAPSWPKDGSIRRLDESIIAVKLSD